MLTLKFSTFACNGLIWRIADGVLQIVAAPHKKRGSQEWSGFYKLVGGKGKFDYKEDPFLTFRRETKEESGLYVHKAELVCVSGEFESLVESGVSHAKLSYIVTPDQWSGEMGVGVTDHTPAVWMDIMEFLQKLLPSQIRLFKRLSSVAKIEDRQFYEFFSM